MKKYILIGTGFLFLLMQSTSCAHSDIPQYDKFEYSKPVDDGKEDWEDDITNFDKPKDVPPYEGFELVENLSDEFNAAEIDLEKWHLTKPGWRGRGSSFMPENLSVKDGILHLRSTVIGTDEQLEELYGLIEDAYVKDNSMHYAEIDANTWDPMEQYGTFWTVDWSDETKTKLDQINALGMDCLGAAAITTKAYGGRGVYEARIKASNIAMSSAFWLQGDHNLEMDITESYGHSSVVENNSNRDSQYHINTSVWLNTPQLGGGLGAVEPQGTLHNTPIYSEWFVLRLDWMEKYLTVYINDKKVYEFPLEGVRTTKPDASGNYYEVPLEYFNCMQQVIFDTEVLMGPTQGWPTKKELMDETRNAFCVDWVRVWKDPNEDWSKAATKDNQHDPLTPIPGGATE